MTSGISGGQQTGDFSDAASPSAGGSNELKNKNTNSVLLLLLLLLLSIVFARRQCF